MRARRMLSALLVATSAAAGLHVQGIGAQTERRTVTVTSGRQSPRPNPALLRKLLCQLDAGDLGALKHTIGRLPGGATFIDEKIERTLGVRIRLMDGSGRVLGMEARNQLLAFTTPFLKGHVRQFSSTAGDATLHLEAVTGRLFESADQARTFLSSIVTPTPLQLTPLDPRVIKFAFSLTDVSPDDGVMLSRVSPRSDGGIAGADRVVAIDLRRNTLDVLVVGDLRSTCTVDYVSDEFCRHFETLGDAARRGFAELKGSEMDNGDRRSTMWLPEATDCRVSGANPALFNCSWRNRPSSAIEHDFNVLARAVQACFPRADVEESDVSPNGGRFVDLLIPRGESDDPFRISLDREPERIVITVQGDK